MSRPDPVLGALLPSRRPDRTDRRGLGARLAARALQIVWLTLVFSAVMALFPKTAHAQRVRDLAEVKGIHERNGIEWPASATAPSTPGGTSESLAALAAVGRPEIALREESTRTIGKGLGEDYGERR